MQILVYLNGQELLDSYFIMHAKLTSDFHVLLGDKSEPDYFSN